MKRPDGNKAVKAALVGVIIALAVVVNGVVLLSVDRFSWKLDMTESKLYQLTPATIKTVETLTSPVEITVFSTRQDFSVMLATLLAKYDGLSGLISVDYKDPFANPVLIDSFQQRGTRILQNDVVIEGNGNFKRYSLEDLYIFNSAKTQVTGIRAEQQITGALILLQSSQTPVARFTDGHNENPSKALMDLFSRNGYQTERVTLSILELPEETDTLVIASPSRDFTGPETGVLNDYLNRGGSLMVFLAPSENSLPNLSSFLERWGILYGDGVVFEPKAHIQDNPVNIVPMYARHEINVYFGENRYFLLMPSSRVLKPAENPGFDLDVMTVLYSTPDSYAKRGSAFVSMEKSPQDPPGPFHLALTSSKKLSPAAAVLSDSKTGEPTSSVREARIFAAGSENLYADDILGMPTFANGDFLVQTINWLNPEQTAVNIPAKTIGSEPLSILPGEAAAAGIVLTGVIPFLILAAGLVVAVKRRRSS